MLQGIILRTRGINRNYQRVQKILIDEEFFLLGIALLDSVSPSSSLNPALLALKHAYADSFEAGPFAFRAGFIGLFSSFNLSDFTLYA